MKKRLGIFLFFTVQTVILNVHTRALAQLEQTKCFACGAVLTNQEIMLCQVACAQEKEVVYVCLRCAQDKDKKHKGKSKKEKVTDGQIDFASPSLEYPRVAALKKEESRKKHEEHLAHSRFPFMDETVQIVLLGGDTVTTEPDRSALRIDFKDGSSKKYEPVAYYGKIKNVVEATGTKVLVIFENEVGQKTVRVFDTHTQALALPSHESIQNVFNQLEKQNKLLDGLYQKIVAKMHDHIPAYIVGLFNAERTTRQELVTLLKDVSCDAQGCVIEKSLSPEQQSEQEKDHK